MLRDWKFDAMQYRDIDRAALEAAEREIEKERQAEREAKGLVEKLNGGSGRATKKHGD